MQLCVFVSRSCFVNGTLQEVVRRESTIRRPIRSIHYLVYGGHGFRALSLSYRAQYLENLSRV